MRGRLVAVFTVIFSAIVCAGQQASFLAEDPGNKYWIKTDVVYDVQNGHENKVDVIYSHNATEAVPAVIYIHGGGWIWGDKAGTGRPSRLLLIL